jgi:hypothetical protein
MPRALKLGIFFAVLLIVLLGVSALKEKLPRTPFVSEAHHRASVWFATTLRNLGENLECRPGNEEKGPVLRFHPNRD